MLADSVLGMLQGNLEFVLIDEQKVVFETALELAESAEAGAKQILIDHRDATLNAMLDEVERTGYKIPTPRGKAIAILVEAIQPKKSHTFRSGKTGGWREHFTDEHKKLFKEVAGDLLVRLGYERSNDW
jgi:hypothetical protein